MNEKPKPSPTSGEGGSVENERILDPPEGMRRMEDFLKRLLKVPKEAINEETPPLNRH